MTHCIVIDDGEPADLSTIKLVKSRKEYACSECGDKIPKGALHEYAHGRWEGTWDTFRTCARCLNVRDEFFEGWYYGGMVECFREEHGFDYRDGLPPDFAPCRPARAR